MLAMATPAWAGDFKINLESVAQPGDFVSANDPASGLAVIVRPWAEGWETFSLTDLDGGKLVSGDGVTLLTWHGRYIQIDFGSANLRTSQQTFVGSWEGFTIEKVAGRAGNEIVDGDTVAIKSMRNDLAGPQYLRVSADTVLGDATSSRDASARFVFHATPITWPKPVLLSAPFAAPSLFHAGNFVDLDPHTGVKRDFRGGTQTYDGHNGIDFGPPGGNQFRVMDDGGLYVIAAAPGTVVFKDDGNFDRCHSDPGQGGATVCLDANNKPANVIGILQADGIVALYVHVMKGSAAVRVGDRVTCGQTLARVGSAGDSSGPHLHFELRRPYDPSFFATRTTIDSNFNGVSHPIDPYLENRWAGSLGTSDAPPVTCNVDGNTSRRDHDIALIPRAALELGAEFDLCGLCGGGLFCNGSGLCQKLGNTGASCSQSNQCNSGLSCQGGSCQPCTVGCPLGCGPAVDGSGTCQKPVLVSCSSCGGACFPTYSGLTFTGCKRWDTQFCSMQCPL